jgi:Cu(I)/Ag(I) efflux system membrane protein CusA/SilA
MLANIIGWSGRNRFLVLFATLFITIAGIYAVLRTPIDALPDLSDVQVIVYTEYPGQAPQVVEDQVTYPLTTAMLSVPKSKVVRGFFVLRRLLRVHHFRGWHRHLLGALARP